MPEIIPPELPDYEGMLREIAIRIFFIEDRLDNIKFYDKRINGIMSDIRRLLFHNWNYGSETEKLVKDKRYYYNELSGNEINEIREKLAFKGALCMKQCDPRNNAPHPAPVSTHIDPPYLAVEETTENLLSWDDVELGKKSPGEILEELSGLAKFQAQLKEYQKKVSFAYATRQRHLRDRIGKLVESVVGMLLPEGYSLNNSGARSDVDVLTQGTSVVISDHLWRLKADGSPVDDGSETANFDKGSLRELGRKIEQLLPGTTYDGPHEEEEDNRGVRHLWLDIKTPPDKLTDLLNSGPLVKKTILGVPGGARAIIVTKETPCDKCGKKHKAIKFQ